MPPSPRQRITSPPRRAGLAGGFPWPCDLGPDLSRGFRALKVWMTLSAYGSEALGGIVDEHCALAQRLAAHVTASNRLELLAPVKLNIVCFGINGFTDAQTADLVADLQEEGLFAPSTTTIGGRLAIRAAIVNHRDHGGGYRRAGGGDFTPGLMPAATAAPAPPAANHHRRRRDINRRCVIARRVAIAGGIIHAARQRRASQRDGRDARQRA